MHQTCVSTHLESMPAKITRAPKNSGNLSALVVRARPRAALATAMMHTSFGCIHATAAYARAALIGFGLFRRSRTLAIVQLLPCMVSDTRVLP